MTERIFRYLREQQPETPCLVVDLDVVENNFRRMRELLPAAHSFYGVKANPAAQILSAAMMLDWLKQPAGAAMIRRAVAASVRRGESTPDLGGPLTTTQMTDAVLKHLDDNSD